MEKLSLEASIPSPGQSAPFSRACTDRAGLARRRGQPGPVAVHPTLRLDHQWLTPLDGSNDSNHSWHLSPSLATSCRFNDQWRSWLSYANGFRRLPTTRCGNIPLLRPAALQDHRQHGLKEEPATASSGAEWRGDNWSIKPALFYNRYYNFIDWRGGAAPERWCHPAPISQRRHETWGPNSPPATG